MKWYNFPRKSSTKNTFGQIKDYQIISTFRKPTNQLPQFFFFIAEIRHLFFCVYLPPNYSPQLRGPHTSFRLLSHSNQVLCQRVSKQLSNSNQSYSVVVVYPYISSIDLSSSNMTRPVKRRQHKYSFILFTQFLNTGLNIAYLLSDIPIIEVFLRGYKLKHVSLSRIQQDVHTQPK